MLESLNPSQGRQVGFAVNEVNRFAPVPKFWCFSGVSISKSLISSVFPPCITTLVSSSAIPRTFPCQAKGLTKDLANPLFSLGAEAEESAIGRWQ